MPISSYVIRCAPQDQPAVREQLSRIPGLEVGEATDTGIPVVAEADTTVLIRGESGTGKELVARALHNLSKRKNKPMISVNAGYEGVMSGTTPGPEPAPVRPVPRGPNGEALARRIGKELPAKVQEIALHGALRTLDYQDLRHANQYLDSLAAFVKLDDADQHYALTVEVARQLALQMAYEDTIRVAELKTRRDRFERIRSQVAAEADQPFLAWRNSATRCRRQWLARFSRHRYSESCWRRCFARDGSSVQPASRVSCSCVRWRECGGSGA